MVKVNRDSEVTVMERRHDLDWVRIAAFGVLILYHVGMYYVSWDWHIKSPHAGATIEPLMLVSSPWRLSLLFLISGVATRYLLDRSQDWFLAGRTWRLLPPLIFGVLVVVPPQAYYELLDSQYPGGYHHGYLAFWARYLIGDGSFCDNEGCLTLPTWNHLWFVAYLWVYTVALALLTSLPRRWVEAAANSASSALAGWGVLLWPLAWLVLARLLLADRFESTHALIDDWYNHAQYFPLFLMGFLVARSEPVWVAIERVRWPALLLAFLSWAYTIWYFMIFAPEGQSSEMLLYAQRAFWALQQWTSIIAVLGFARRLAPRDSPALRYLSEAVFPIYLLHQTLIIIIAWQLRPFALLPGVEAPLLTLLTLVACFAAFELVRRLGWLRPLMGLKRQRTARPKLMQGLLGSSNGRYPQP